MTIEKAEEWAKHWVSLPHLTYPCLCLLYAESSCHILFSQHDNDVDLEHPLSHLSYNLEKRTPKLALSAPISTQSPVMNSDQVSQLVLGLAQGMGAVYGDHQLTPGCSFPICHTMVSTTDRAHGPHSTSPPLSSSPPTCQEPSEKNGIDGLLNDLELLPGRKQDLRDVLINLEIYDYRLITQTCLPWEQLREAGLKDGMINSLHHDQEKYQRRKERQRRQDHAARDMLNDQDFNLIWIKPFVWPRFEGVSTRHVCKKLHAHVSYLPNFS